MDEAELVLVREIASGEYRMAKKVRLRGEEAEGEGEALVDEAALLRELHHPHVLRYHDIHLEGDLLVSLLEFCECTSRGTQRATWGRTWGGVARGRRCAARSWCFRG